MEKLVCEFHQDDETRLKHYNDLKYTSIILFNAVVDSLRKSSVSNTSWIETVLKTSDVIEETTLMREQAKGDESAYKQELHNWHLVEDNEKMLYRIPNKVKTYVQFRNKKRCKAKDLVVEFVTKLYRIDMQNRKDVVNDIAHNK